MRKGIIAAALLLLLAIAGQARSSEIYYWRLAEEEVEGSVCDLYAREFARLLDEKSDGRINLTIFPLGTLGTPQEIYQLCRQGSIEFVLDGAGQVGDFVPENQVFSIPFLFPDDQDLNEHILNTSRALNETLTSVYEEDGVTVLAYWSEGAMDWTSKRPLLHPKDFKGLKIRTMPSGIIAESYRILGADPKVVSFMEVYSNLQLGIVEAQENAPYIVQEMGFMDSQNYYIRSQHKIYVMQTMANLNFWRSLPEDIRAIVTESIEELRPYGMKAQMDLNKKRLEEIKSSMSRGQRYLELDESHRKDFIETIGDKVEKLYLEKVRDKEKGSLILKELKEEIKRARALP